MQQKIITLSSDFEKQSQGVGNMEAVIFAINPSARVIHLMHGIPPFDLFTAARAMETVYFMPVGFHVCVVDPEVGTNRRGIIVKVKRGDYFVGPDNGCLMTAPRMLGGIEKVVEISNEKFMQTPVSPIFHGRHIFSPAAAYLSLGTPMEEFGDEIKALHCVKAPFEEAVVGKNKIEALAIHKNHFGSIHLNIGENVWDELGVKLGEFVEMSFGKKTIKLPFVSTFGDVKKGQALIMKDDYNRVEVAVNQGSFSKAFGLGAGRKAVIRKIT